MSWEGDSRKPGKPSGESGGKGGGGAPPRREIDAESCPVTALGRLKGRYFFFSPSGEERELTVRQLYKREGLEDLFEGDLRWLQEWFHNDEGALHVFSAGRWLLRACVAAGLFDPEMPRRGPGVWRQGARLVVHTGDRVLIDGFEPRRAGFREADMLYPLAPRVRPPAPHPATATDGARLRESVALWRFEDSRGPDLVTGLIGLSHLGAAPDWRVHGFVRAPYGSGKSWLAEFFAHAAGARPPNNNVTPAAIYQGLTGEARALVIDEAEKSDRDDRVTQVIELIRLMSGRGGARIGRGSAEGRSRAFQINGTAFLTAILHPELRPQDRSRFIVLRLRPLATGPGAVGQQDRALQALEFAEAIAPALQARAVAGWSRFLDTVALYRAAAMREDVEPRSADSIAAALAGRDLLLREDIPLVSEAEGEIDALAYLLVRKDDRAIDGEGEQCLVHLLSSHVETWGGGERKTIGEKVIEAQQPGAQRNGINEILGRCGLRLRFRVESGAFLLESLLVARAHVGLDRIFKDTRWSGGVWRQALEDLDGVASWGPTHFAGAKSTRCTAVPPDYLPGADEPDGQAGPEPPHLPPD